MSSPVSDWTVFQPADHDLQQFGERQRAFYEQLPQSVGSAESTHEVSQEEALKASSEPFSSQEASFESQSKKLLSLLRASYPALVGPVDAFLKRQATSKRVRHPTVTTIHDCYGFKFQCYGLMMVCKPILQEIKDLCDASNAVYNLGHISVPSGSLEDSMITLANFPTFCTKQQEFGQFADLTNPCVRLLDTAVQGLVSILGLDRLAYRTQRSKALPSPEEALTDSLRSLLMRLWYAVWTASKAVTGVLLGKSQVEAYRQRFPHSTSVRLYDKRFYDSFDHLFVERDIATNEVKRLVFVIYHMESWLKQVWPQTLLGIKESLASALTFAYPAWDIGNTWRLPMQPITSPELLLKSIMQDKPMTFTLRIENFYDLFDMTVRLMLAEHIAGIRLDTVRLPERMRSFALPQSFSSQEAVESYNSWPALLTRAANDMDTAVNEYKHCVALLTDEERNITTHPHAQIFCSVLWPAVIRMSHRYDEIASPGSQTGSSFISNRIDTTLGRKVISVLKTLKVRDHFGQQAAIYEYKKIMALRSRKYDVASYSQLLRLFMDQEELEAIKDAMLHRKERFNEVKKRGITYDDPIRGLSITQTSLDAVQILSKYANHSWVGASGVRSWYESKLKSAKAGTPRYILLNDDLDLGKKTQKRGDWEKRVLSRVLAADRSKLPARYNKQRCVTAVKESELRVSVAS